MRRKQNAPRPASPRAADRRDRLFEFNEVGLEAGNGFVRVSDVVPGILQEVVRRAALRHRLEAERGGPITDEEFLDIVERTGGIEL